MFQSPAPHLDAAKVAALADEMLDWKYQAVPAALQNQNVGDFLAGAPTLAQLQTPVLVLDAQAMESNMRKFASWCTAHGVLAAPHGKTTMSPALWQRQIDHGAWAITLANSHQLRVARAFGLSRIMIANTVTDPQAIAYLAQEILAGAEIYCWVDSVQAVELLSAQLRNVPEAVLPLIVELGGAGGRTGVRSLDGALEIARAVKDSPQLRLTGVGGYEGALAHTTDEAAIAAVRGYLSNIGELHGLLQGEDLYDTDQVILTAGGSAYFDDVATVLARYVAEPSASGPAVRVVIRSGAYIVHDDGFYREISPLGRQFPDGPESFTSAMHAWARVASVPETGLAILDVGKRDVPFDEGLPTVQCIAEGLGEPTRALAEARISAVNDQHAFMHFARDEYVKPGDVIRLGLSHPCTAFDKWQLIPVLESTTATQNPVIVDLLRTFF